MKKPHVPDLDYENLWRTWPLFIWRPCEACKRYFRHEWGWRALIPWSGWGYPHYYCRSCFPNRASLVEYLLSGAYRDKKPGPPPPPPPIRTIREGTDRVRFKEPKVPPVDLKSRTAVRAEICKIDPDSGLELKREFLLLNVTNYCLRDEADIDHLAQLLKETLAKRALVEEEDDPT